MYCKEDGCQRKYRGTTGGSNHGRIGEQVRDWDSGVQEYPLLSHSRLFHEGRRFDFGVKILRSCYGKPSRRMITEAVLINELTEEETMNSICVRYT